MQHWLPIWAFLSNPAPRLKYASQMVEFLQTPTAKFHLNLPSLASPIRKPSMLLPLACTQLFLACPGSNPSIQSLIGAAKPFYRISSTICPLFRHLRHPNRRTSLHYARPPRCLPPYNASPNATVPNA